MSTEQKTTPKKSPDQWATGEQPMTDAQSSYLKTLCTKAGEDFDETLTKAQASKRIDQLRTQTSAVRAQA